MQACGYLPTPSDTIRSIRMLFPISNRSWLPTLQRCQQKRGTAARRQNRAQGARRQRGNGDSLSQFVNTTYSMKTYLSSGKLILLAGLLAISYPLRAMPGSEPGSIDSSFVNTNVFDGRITSVTALPDGHILVLGDFKTVNGVATMGLARLDADGAIDPQFSGLGLDKAPVCLTVLPQGKMVLGGPFTSYFGVPRKGLAQLYADGSLDPSFEPADGTPGPVTYLEASPSADRFLVGGNSLDDPSYGPLNPWVGQLQQNGGFSLLPSNMPVPARVLWQADGTMLSMRWIPLDDVTDGYYSLFRGLLERWICNVAGDLVFVQPDGNILVSVSPPNSDAPQLRRYFPDGSRDMSFRSDVLPFNCIGSVVVLSSSNVVVASNCDYSGDVVRLTSEGVYDPTFTFVPPREGIAGPLASEAGGKVLVAWAYSTNGSYRSLLLRVHSEDPIPGSGHLNFAYSTFAVNEGVGSAYLTITRQHGVEGEVTAECVAVGGSAKEHVDYVLPSTQVRLGAGERYRTVLVQILDDRAALGDKTIEFELRSPTGGAVLGSRVKTTLQIDDSVSVMSFGSSRWVLDEGDPDARVSIVRVGRTNEAVTVQLAVGSGTAVLGQDFRAAQGLVSFAPGEMVRNVECPTADDEELSGTKRNSLGLSNPTGVGIVGNVATSELEILDNDGVGWVDSKYSMPVATNATVAALAAQSNGRILVGYDLSLQDHILIERLMPDLSLDSSFKMSTESALMGHLIALAETELGIVVVGSQRVHCLARDGSLVCGYPNLFSELPVEILSSGRLLVAKGDGVIRVDLSGKPDLTYVQSSCGYKIGRIVCQTNGAAILLPTLQQQPFCSLRLVRLAPDGAVDPDFEIWVSYPVSALAVASDGGIFVGDFVVSMTREYFWWIHRFGPDGEREFSVEVPYSALALVPQPDGSVLASGSRLFRILRDGSLDSQFQGRMLFSAPFLIAEDGGVTFATESSPSTLTRIRGTGLLRLASPVPLGNSKVLLSVQSNPPRASVIDRSEDLRSWVPVTTNSAPVSSYDFMDAGTGFYRARSWP